MRAFVGVTDGEWFDLLARTPGLEEVNFWQPSGNTFFRALQQGELFLFKLHSPDNFIVGGGVFAHNTLLPVSRAWSDFGVSNGARSLEEMRRRVEHYRRRPADAFEDYTIGCIILTQPFFLPRASWIPVPPDFKRNIVRGRSYNLEVEPGRSLFQSLESALRSQTASRLLAVGEMPPLLQDRYGKPILVKPRLGQGTFRALVTDAYSRRCSLTGERVLPVLEAAHIRPYAKGGEHVVNNGLLLRSDLHTLFDNGYITISPDLRVRISRRIREEFENGRDYYALADRRIRPPEFQGSEPAREALAWHNQNIFRP